MLALTYAYHALVMHLVNIILVYVSALLYQFIQTLL